MKVIITGGAGFIGGNAAARYLDRGCEVVVIDSLTRPGAASNLVGIKAHGSPIFSQTDVRDAESIETVFRTHRDASVVLHLAGQVAVTTSVADPRLDFEVNALGTLNVLEAMRCAGMEAAFIYASTNKVYGEVAGVEVVEGPARYEYAGLPHGIAEDRLLDFHSPYGCSKGTADQYVRDYSRIFGLDTVVFRQSCIYGTHQFGNEDQGWIAWFLIAAELGIPLTLYGNGKQVRDVLFIDDLLDAFDAAVKNIKRARGQIYNIGGGPSNAISLLNLISEISAQRKQPFNYSLAPTRPGDQRIYVSDIRRAAKHLEWEPRIAWRDGVGRLRQWIRANRDECARIIDSYRVGNGSVSAK